jgi:L-alanine-DL-glutamate epimerase-like enolase superfamily enzyme
VVELLTDSGLTGLAIGADGAHAQIERLVGEMLVGADPRATSGLWQQMTDGTPNKFAGDDRCAGRAPGMRRRR